MRILLQRVLSASVTVGDETTGAIGPGLLVFIGVGHGDTMAHADYLIEKILNLRVFEDAGGKMNRTLQDVDGGLLLISQFTLYADIRKGRRPSFDRAAPPEQARELYEYFVNQAINRHSKTACGRFQSHMIVTSANDGPISIYYDAVDKFPDKSQSV